MQVRPASPTSYSFNLGDIRDGDRRVFLVELRPNEFREGATNRADVILTFDSPATGAREQHILHSQAIFTKDAATVQSSEDARAAGHTGFAGVMIHRSILDAMETAEEALKGLDIERFRQAKGLFDRVYVEARQHAIDERDQQLLNYAFLLKYFTAELETASQSGLMHDHSEAPARPVQPAARGRISRKVDYRRYLMGHHRGQPKSSLPDHP